MVFQPWFAYFDEFSFVNVESLGQLRSVKVYLETSLRALLLCLADISKSWENIRDIEHLRASRPAICNIWSDSKLIKTPLRNSVNCASIIVEKYLVLDV
jgi:hypothetical protein